MNAGRNSGISLILVLGILSLVTVLAAVIARSVATGRSAARQSADRTRAEQLLHVAINRAMEDISADMRGYTYPCWGSTNTDATASPGTVLCADIFSPDAALLVPRSLWPDAEAAASACGWTNIPAANGRIAYLVINASGLVDANTLGETNTVCDQLQYGLFNDIPDTNVFRSDLDAHRRYESIPELESLNRGIGMPVSNLFVASVALDPDVRVDDPALLGTPGVVLLPKLRINDFSASGNYLDNEEFMTNYFAAVTGLCVRAGYTEADAVTLAWNLVNDLDDDRIPQGPTSAWHEAVVEAVPLINEIAVQEIAGLSNWYEVVVELWYPFERPGLTNDTDVFTLEVGVFSNDVAGVSDESVMAFRDAQWSFSLPFSSMKFGTEAEFMCFTSPVANRIQFTDGTNVYPLSEWRPVYLLARVMLGADIVDEAMGYDHAGDPDMRLKMFTNPAVYSVADPLWNGRVSAWTGAAPGTFGAINANCNPWGAGKSGVPVVHHDTQPMLRTGDIGYLPIPGPSADWRDVDLTSTNGATLAGVMTARTTNDTHRGLVCVSTRQKEVLRALFRGNMTESEADQISSFINGPYLDIQDLLVGLGQDSAYTSWPLKGRTDGNVKEDAIRDLPDWATFRQNVFIIVAAAQVMSPNGAGVLAEQRCVAIVCRDAFTGASRVRAARKLRD